MSDKFYWSGDYSDWNSPSVLQDAIPYDASVFGWVTYRAYNGELGYIRMMETANGAIGEEDLPPEAVIVAWTKEKP